jgi:hypothetical protein
VPDATIKSVSASAYTVPTDAPEADGTFAWNSTTLVLAEVNAAGKTGIGYSYTDAAAASVVNGALAGLLSILTLSRSRSPMKSCSGAFAISAGLGSLRPQSQR